MRIRAGQAEVGLDRWVGVGFGALFAASVVGYRRVFGRAGAEMATRMTAEEARLAAVARMEDAPFGGAAQARAEVRDGRVVWLVQSMTKGSGWSAEVEDATGVCLEVKHWGIR